MCWSAGRPNRVLIADLFLPPGRTLIQIQIRSKGSAIRTCCTLHLSVLTGCCVTMSRRGQHSPLDDSSFSDEEEESSFLSEAMREHQNQILMAYHLGLLDCNLDRLPKEVWKHVLQNDLFIDVCNRWPTLSSDLENKMHMILQSGQADLRCYCWAHHGELPLSNKYLSK